MYLYANFNTTLYAETRITATLDDGKKHLWTSSRALTLSQTKQLID